MKLMIYRPLMTPIEMCAKTVTYSAKDVTLPLVTVEIKPENSMIREN